MPDLTRRAALGLLVAGTVSGCGIRLEDDAPRVPLVPTREPIAGEAALVELLAGTTALAAAVAGGEQADYAGGLAAQATTLDSALRERGVPQSVISPTPTTSATGTGTGTESGAGATTPAPATTEFGASSDSGETGDSGATGSGGAASEESDSDADTGGATTRSAPSGSSMASTDGVGAAALASAVAARDLLETVEVDLRPTLAALSAQRVTLARATGVTRGLPRAAPADLPEQVALDHLAATREAVYGVEVAAARATETVRERAIATLGELRGSVLLQEKRLGAAVPPTPTAYVLPLEVTDDSTATRLIRYLTSGLVDAVAATLPTLAEDPPALLTATDRLTDACLMGLRWGVVPGPFPGMS